MIPPTVTKKVVGVFVRFRAPLKADLAGLLLLRGGYPRDETGGVVDSNDLERGW
jgi:hypothetical protein